jgi:hypothetical protein
MHIRAPKDFWSGLMFLAFALTTMLAARGYSMGSAGRMGPGYFPMLLGFVLAGLAAVLIVRSFAFEGEALPRLQLGPLSVMTFAVCLFALSVEPLGLVVSLAILVLVAARAGHEFRLGETVALAAALIVFSVGVFVYALKLPLAVWPDF